MIAARMSSGSLASDCVERLRGARRSRRARSGACRCASCASWMAVTASPSDSPGARLNEIVTAGNWPWWLMASGAVVVVSCTIALSGTGAPVGVRTKILSSASAVARLLRLHLEDDAVQVQLREDDRDLALAERVVERVVDLLRRDAEARRRVAVDRERHLEPGRLLVARDVAEHVLLAQLRDELGAHVASSLGSASSSVYWYCVRLTRLSICRSCTACRYTWMPSTAASFGWRRAMISSALDDALVVGLEGNREPPAVGRRVRPVRPDERRDALRRRDPSRTMSATSRWSSIIRGNDTSGAASETPSSEPVSCCGKNPLGMRSRARSSAPSVAIVDEERGQLVAQDDAQPAVVEGDRALEGALRRTGSSAPRSCSFGSGRSRWAHIIGVSVSDRSGRDADRRPRA